MLVFFGTKSIVLALFAYLGFGIYERINTLGSGALNPLGTGKRKKVFLESVFLLMGKLAKADGRVSEAEVQLAEQLFAQLHLSTEHRTQAIELFKQGASDNFDTEETLTRFMQICGSTRSLKQTLLVYLISLALVDGEFHPSEEAVLLDIANRLQFSQQEFFNLLEMIKNQAHFSNDKMPSQDAVQLAYKALGTTENASNQELKKAYRRLMSQNHPDKLIGQGLPDDMIQLATEKSKEIQKAYELIKNHRERN